MYLRGLNSVLEYVRHLKIMGMHVSFYRSCYYITFFDIT